MKIGVALSGCDIGGVGAYRVIEEIGRQGFEIEMISACCVPSTAVLACAYGYTDGQIESMARRFLFAAADGDLDAAVGGFADTVKLRPWKRRLPLAVSAVDVASGQAVVFTDELAVDSPALCTVPLLDSYDVLSATMSGLRGLRPYPFRGRRLSDYSARFGPPVLPLRMLGVKRILSVSFLPAQPTDAYEAMLSRAVSRPPDEAVVQLNLEFPPFPAGGKPLGAYLDAAIPTVLGRVRESCHSLLLA